MAEIEINRNLEVESEHQLIIRGHHLYRYIELMSEISALKKSGEGLTKVALENVINTYIATFIEKLKRNEESYVYDVLGDTGEPAFIDSMLGQFHLFLYFEPTYPVRLTTGIDGICGGCATGSHCHVLQRYDQVVLKKVANKLNKVIVEKEGGHHEVLLSLGDFRELVLNDEVLKE